MRDIFHCTPSQLDEEDHSRILLYLDLLRIENEVENAKSGNNPSKSKTFNEALADEKLKDVFVTDK